MFVNKKLIFSTIIALLISSTVLAFASQTFNDPIPVYKVYLDGQEIGNIKSKKALEEYINKSQKELKKKYQVDNVFMPNNLHIKKDTTYFSKIDEVKDIYEKIRKMSPFTIDGYEINIKGIKKMTEAGEVLTENKKIFTIDEKTFETALKKTVYAFVPENEYGKYINGTQAEIKDYGRRIDNLKVLNNITIKKNKISTEEKIFTDEDKLSQYLLFGSEDATKDYYVAAGDNIKDVSFNNKLSVEEFMIANPSITSPDNLLYPGQKVSVAFIDPVFTLERNDYVVERQTKGFETVIEKDATLSEGVQKIKQNGVNGVSKVTSNYRYINGQLDGFVKISEEQISAPINKIVVQGTKYIPNVGHLGMWAWPTAQPYIITSPFAWRWGKMHEAIDIAGPGQGSPIFAANNGTIVESGQRWPDGKYILIDHNNGFFTMYAHLNQNFTAVGQTVAMGEKIGTMGRTGLATGVHLHFGTYNGYPYRGGRSFNPLTLY